MEQELLADLLQQFFCVYDLLYFGGNAADLCAGIAAWQPEGNRPRNNSVRYRGRHLPSVSRQVAE